MAIGSVVVPHRWHDWIPAAVKVGFKRLFWPIGSAYQTVVSGGGQRADWLLGMQPDRVLMRQLEKRYGRIQLISILTDRELIVTDKELEQCWPNWLRWRHVWYDHSVCSPIDGRNQSVASFKRRLASVYGLWLLSDCSIWYCHCMAGRGRSFLFLLAWLLFYGDKVGDQYLPEAANIAELAGLIVGRRSQVFGLAGLEGEQLGFAGLLALDWLVGKSLNWWQRRDPIRLQLDLQCVGLALAATLDSTYRRAEDLAAQQHHVAQLLTLTNGMGIRRDVLELLLWAPPWSDLISGLVFEMLPSQLRDLKVKAWRQLPKVARANWHRWQWWWITAQAS